jgi:hypothetical protein
VRTSGIDNLLHGFTIIRCFVREGSGRFPRASS